jgi:hypothetical protein
MKNRPEQVSYGRVRGEHCWLIVSNVGIGPNAWILPGERPLRRSIDEKARLLLSNFASAECLNLHGRRPRWCCGVIKQMPNVGKLRQLNVLSFDSEPLIK